MRVRKAEYVKDYTIILQFSDGITKVVDFKQFMDSQRKLIIPLWDAEYFKRFFVDEITICWPNGLDFSPDLLYEAGKEIREQKKQVKSQPKRIKHQSIATTAKKRRTIVKK
ncbi:MAG: DUF2442 domain-containing protein [Parachlamydiaceae bacterium]